MAKRQDSVTGLLILTVAQVVLTQGLPMAAQQTLHLPASPQTTAPTAVLPILMRLTLVLRQDPRPLTARTRAAALLL